MKKIIFYLGSILLLFLAGCSSIPQVNQKIDSQSPRHKILLIKERWHTSIVLEAQPLLMVMPELNNELNDQPYVRVGWGDGDFFSGKNKSGFSATRALFISSYSAMQVLAYDQLPVDDFDKNDRVILLVDNDGFKKLIEFIRNSFVYTADGSLKPLQAYQKNTGSFFLAQEHYSVFNNCNSWTAKALGAAGFSVGLHLTPSGLLQSAKNISSKQLDDNYH